jgi:hypothetical protein
MANKNKIGLLLACLVLSLNLSAQTIVQFRGPARNGIYPETNLLKSWPAEGPAMLWKAVGIGNGYSSPIITENRIYVTGEIDSIGYLFAFDKSGVLIWKKYAVANGWRTSPGRDQRQRLWMDCSMFQPVWAGSSVLMLSQAMKNGRLIS